MGITNIATNISAINAQRNIESIGSNISRSIERLSSGLRINRAADDAAGLSVANRIRSQTEGLNQAITNSQDGINLVNVAEGALEETTNRLNRIRQLSLQAANTGTNDFKARAAIQDEIFQNIDEITRIANTTQFGSNFLLNGDFAIKSSLREGQPDLGFELDASPVASSLKSGTAFLNIRQTKVGYSQIVAGDAVGGQQIVNTGIRNQTDVAVSLASFNLGRSFTGGAVTTGSDVQTGMFFNGVSVSNQDIIVFEGVLADGVTQFAGSVSLGDTSTLGTAADASATNPASIVGAINKAIDDAEKVLFGVNSTSSVPTAFRTTATLADSTGDNRGRLVFYNEGNYINRTDIEFSLFRNGTAVTRSEGVVRAGSIGANSSLTGGGQVGNAVTAITGSTFSDGQFSITVKDVQSTQQRTVESTIAFLDGNGTRLNRNTTLSASNQTNTMVLNGTFSGSVYTGGQTLSDDDLIILTGTNADGSTFEGRFTYVDPADDNELTSSDTTFNDFKFSTISGLIQELNYRTRDYDSTSETDDGAQTRFEDALFTFTPGGTLKLVDDVGRSDSQTNFTITFQNKDSATPSEYFTLQDDAALNQEGYAEQATFQIDGGEEVRAEAGEVITLQGPESTVEGVPSPQVTLRVGSGFSLGADKFENVQSEYVGSLNGGNNVTFTPGEQDVAFFTPTSTREAPKFVTVDFDAFINVTSNGAADDNGITAIISTSNTALNFQIGAFNDQTLEISVGDLKADNLGFGQGSGRTVADINVSTFEGANDAVEIIDEALDQVNRTRSILGAATNRLEAAVASLSVASENLTAAESRIRDANIADETSQFTLNQVLLQAGTSVLAQANFQSQTFLQLLG